MIAPFHTHRRRSGRRLRTMAERRQRMIRETNAFLAWALRRERAGKPLPRIPRLRVDQGGFTDIISTAGGRAMIRYWWKQNVWDKRWRFS